ncbi:type II toxin-antitoxin system VapC family toxin [Moraxella lacunata]|uniref:PIN domain-containing protein n=1 Tax=Moraxella lacunata TaxID=477 RepID=A0A1V4H1V7_MORLA|nr:type II toxin-antitoxin system VapC family toxin [Moraxella lacunata]OPH38904.1 hypothetical protein B5J94_01845 [Moraxella lacunata]
MSADDNAVKFIKQHQGNLAISILTVMEVLSYPFDDEQATKVENFLQKSFVWLEINHDIIFKTAHIRRIKKMKGIDALIAGTALVHHLPLATRNLKDFTHLPIELINPIDKSV